MRAKRRMWAIVGVTMAMAIGDGGVGVAGASRTAGPSRPVPARAASPVPSVRVERTLVVAAEEVVERPVRAGRARARPQRGTAAPPLMSRARRVLFGSGRHRPEPFPRVSEAGFDSRADHDRLMPLSSAGAATLLS